MISEPKYVWAMNGFLRAPLAPVIAPVIEQIATFSLPITGRLSAELNGWYLRPEPNPMALGDPNYHWFVGTGGLLYGVRLRDARADRYRERWARSKAVPETLGEKWPGGPVHGKDTAPNSCILSHPGHILAAVESGPLPYELSDKRSTRHWWDFEGTPRVGFAAHAKPDPQTGEPHAVAYSAFAHNVQHVAVGKPGRVIHVVEIAVVGEPMMHDCATTGRHVVL